MFPGLFGVLLTARIASTLVDVSVPVASGLVVDALAAGSRDNPEPIWRALAIFIGLGAVPPTPEWGAILTLGRKYINQAWWYTTFPGIAIIITVLGINMLGDALRDALDPKLRR